MKSIGAVSAATAANLGYGIFGASLYELAAGDWNGAGVDLQNRLRAVFMTKGGREAYLWPFIVAVLGAKAATSWGINPGHTFGKGKKAIRGRLF